MCMLMSRHTTLDRSRVLDFYYRRFKRIVPVYLFVILLVLCSATFLWLYPMDFKSLENETLKPVLFLANVPDDDEANYFAQVGSYTLTELNF
jgi:peptidoglycan/LPS O-acetylase OafA/YrhL